MPTAAMNDVNGVLNIRGFAYYLHGLLRLFNKMVVGILPKSKCNLSR